MIAMRLDVVRRELAQGAETITSLVVGVSPEEARVHLAAKIREIAGRENEIVCSGFFAGRSG